jgi:hypothetical protein
MLESSEQKIGALGLANKKLDELIEWKLALIGVGGQQRLVRE